MSESFGMTVSQLEEYIHSLLIDREALVRLSSVLMRSGWHIYQLENDLEEWQVLPQELKDSIRGYND